ncbi:B-cell receptor-associated protein 31 [Clonorchis sinensis]|uniref:Endoplasmic reticulum transmembrane protein n=1 Tax=Clonorchis sinensis TaxID=79923 RepID=G7YLX1_CLOSI|nr:B-cell receptor-associated protein 31 [Clonorchis sinensis]
MAKTKESRLWARILSDTDAFRPDIMLWHLTAAFLYLEMFTVFLLIIPLFSSRSWAKFFKTEWVQKFAAFSTYYFNFFLVLLGLVLLEALRQVMNQRSAYETLKSHPSELRPETESLYLMRMFRAQRNLYIAGFALFMWFVFRRLIRLISEHAQMSASQEASLKQAKNASAVAEQILSSRGDEESEIVKRLKAELEDLKQKLQEEEESHETTKQDLVTLKKQATQTAQEYDRVATECQELQRRITLMSEPSADKKSD